MGLLGVGLKVLNSMLWRDCSKFFQLAQTDQFAKFCLLHQHLSSVVEVVRLVCVLQVKQVCLVDAHKAKYPTVNV